MICALTSIVLFLRLLNYRVRIVNPSIIKWLISGGHSWELQFQPLLLGKLSEWKEEELRSRDWRPLGDVRRTLTMSLFAREFARRKGCWRRLKRSQRIPPLTLAWLSVGFRSLMPVQTLVLELFVSTSIRCQIGMTFALGGAKVNASSSHHRHRLFRKWYEVLIIPSFCLTISECN